MIVFFQAVCICSCLLTGIFYLIMHKLGTGVKFSIWYPVLCFAFAAHMTLSNSIAPWKLAQSVSEHSITNNLYLISYNLAVFLLFVYTASIIEHEKKTYFKVVCYCFVPIILSSIIAVDHLLYSLVVFSMLLCLVAYAYGFFSSIVCINFISKTYIFSLVSYVILFIGVIFDLIFYFNEVKLYSSRLITLPIFFALHSLMLTVQYNISQGRTTDISQALSESFEGLGHSDNALKCTQMKPDFLYETLDLISEKCESDPFTAEDLTISLSKYLRHTLHFQQLQGVVPLSNEIELTKAYASIKREEYPKIRFSYDIPMILPNVSVPPLSIQPLVENAIEHGLSSVENGGTITVSVIIAGENCTVKVQDDGAGMPREMLDGLPDSFSQTARIGLYDINKRLMTCFNTTLEIHSSPNEGTYVSFTVPCEEVAENG